MARFARGGFCMGSTGISSQKVYYYNYSDTDIFGISETLLLDQKKIKLIF